MSLESDLIDGLEEFRDRLRSGERIVCSTVERCACNDTGEIRTEIQISASNCHLCAGKGWIISARTIFPSSRPPEDSKRIR